MKRWRVKDAKARFSELLVACEREGPQLVTKRGVGAAVLIPFEEWRRLSAHVRPTLKDLLLSDQARFDDLEIPPRG
jgi:antitoxin Phd